MHRKIDIIAPVLLIRFAKSVRALKAKPTPSMVIAIYTAQSFPLWSIIPIIVVVFVICDPHLSVEAPLIGRQVILPLALTFLFLVLNAAANASARPPPPEGAEGALAPPEGPVVGAPGTAAALRSRFSAELTLFNFPPPTPPLARIEASTSSLPPTGLGSGGAPRVSRPGGNGGGGGPLEEGMGGGGGA